MMQMRWQNKKPLVCHYFKAVLKSSGTWWYSETKSEVGFLGLESLFPTTGRMQRAQSRNEVHALTWFFSWTEQKAVSSTLTMGK